MLYNVTVVFFGQGLCKFPPGNAVVFLLVGFPQVYFICCREPQWYIRSWSLYVFHSSTAAGLQLNCLQVFYNNFNRNLVIRDCIGLLLLRSVIGSENSLHSQPIEWRNETNHDLVARVSRALGSLLVLTLSSHWP